MNSVNLSKIRQSFVKSMSWYIYLKFNWLIRKKCLFLSLTSKIALIVYFLSLFSFKEIIFIL